MNRRLFSILIIVLLLLTTVIAGCASTSRIDSFFQNGEYRSHAKLIDFMIFFVLFFAMAFLGFSKWFGEGFGKAGGAKGAVIGLSVALSLMLSFALITQTKFSISTLFPLAKAVLFLVFCLLMYGLLNQIITSDTKTGKIVTFILACILVYILMSIFTHFACQMSDNMDDPACRSDFFNAFSKLGFRHIWGPGTLFGGSSGTSSAGWQFGTSDSGKSSASGSAGGTSPGPGPGTEPGPEAGPDTKKKDDGTPAGSSSTGWPWYMWLLLLLLIGGMGVGIYIWRTTNRRNQQDTRVNDLIAEQRRLIQAKMDIWQQVPGAANPADDNALTAVLNGINTATGIFRRHPDTAPINAFFNAIAGGAPQHYPQLQGNLRNELRDILIREKNIQYELGQLMNWWRRYFTNRLIQIDQQEDNMNNLIFSPKFHADLTVEVMFDANNIPNFDDTRMPSVGFVGAPPPRMNNPDLMQNHSPGVYNRNLGQITGTWNYLYWYHTQGVPAPLWTVDILNPVRVPANNASRFTVVYGAFRINP